MNELIYEVKILLASRKISDEKIIDALRQVEYDVGEAFDSLSIEYDRLEKIKLEKLEKQKQLKEEKQRRQAEAAAAALPKLEKKMDDLSVSKKAQVLPSLKPKLDLDKEIQNAVLKPLISFVVIGHVDAGKSTLMGRLLLDVGAVDSKVVAEFKRESERIGKSSFHLAWVLDQTQEERERGVTMDFCQRSFETDTARFSILDAPGHRDFIPNMIAGSSQADLSVLVVDASVGAFESGFSLQGTTREHALLVRSLGVTRLIVAVNKLDTIESISVEQAEQRYHEVIDYLKPFLSSIGYRDADVSYVPCSGLHGYNVVTKSTSSLSWYSGPSLLQLLESKPVVQKDHSAPFRMTVTDSYKLANTSQVHARGRITAGAIQVGDSAVVVPENISVKARGILVNDTPTQWAKAGDLVDIDIAGIEDPEKIQPSDILCPPGKLVPVVRKFRGTLVTFQLQRPIIKGMRVMLHRGRINLPATISKITELVSKSDCSVIKEKPRFVSSNQAANVEVKLLDDTIPMEPFKVSKDLGRVILRQEGFTIGALVVEEVVTHKNKPEKSAEEKAEV